MSRGSSVQLFAGCDAVINLVGILNPHGRASFEAVHTELAAKVLAAARTAGVRRVLHMSALGADPHGPSRYLRSKAAAEARLRAAPHPELPHAEPAVTIFRPSVIFGPRDSLTNRFAGLLRLHGGAGCRWRARGRASRPSASSTSRTPGARTRRARQRRADL